MGYIEKRKIHSNFSQGFGFKTKDSNTFKSKFEVRPNKNKFE
jgi:hypothetical protein